MSRKPIDAHIRSGEDAPDADEREIRNAFASWTSGVTIVAVRTPAGVTGLTVSAFLPLSLRPPQVLVSIHGDAPLVSHLADAKRFVVNILSEDQRGPATRFSDRFPVGPSAFPASGDPVLPGSLVAFVCRIEDIRPAGDHRLVTGAIEAVVPGPPARPLLYGERGWRALA